MYKCDENIIYTIYPTACYTKMTKYNHLTQSIITHTLQAFQAHYFSKIEIKAVDYVLCC